MGIEELNRQFITPRGRWMPELWPSKDLSYDAFDLKGYGRILVLSQRALPCLHSSIITDCMYYVKGFDYLYPPNLYPPNFCSVATLLQKLLHSCTARVPWQRYKTCLRARPPPCALGPANTTMRDPSAPR